MVDTLQENPDVIVIGGGPAGSSVATLIAQKGYRVELFEREHFPRFHIGESFERKMKKWRVNRNHNHNHNPIKIMITIMIAGLLRCGPYSGTAQSASET